MPIKYLPKINAFKYGSTGKAYKASEYGKAGAREKARKQGQAIYLNSARAGGENIPLPHSIKVKASKRARSYERRI